jgi:hypothetical protein
MKHSISNLLAKRNSQINLACVILILLVLVLGCSDSGDSNSSCETTKKPVPPAYIGIWTGQDGSTVTIRNDGSGDYKSGGSSVNGGTVEIDEAVKEIRFSFMGFDSGKYKIDQPPKKNKMRLDGMEYRRTGGFSVDEPEKTSDAANSGETPSEDELRLLVGETIQNLDRAIQQGDVGDFYATISERWKRQTTVAELNKAFASVMRRKDVHKLKDGAPLAFTTELSLGNEGNTFEIDGSYPTTKGKNIPFRLRYVTENDEWKLLGIYLNP